MYFLAFIQAQYENAQSVIDLYINRTSWVIPSMEETVAKSALSVAEEVLNVCT